METIHDTYGRQIGNDAITLRQRLENMLKQDVKKKSLIGIKFGVHYIMSKYRVKEWKDLLEKVYKEDSPRRIIFKKNV